MQVRQPRNQIIAAPKPFFLDPNGQFTPTQFEHRKLFATAIHALVRRGDERHPQSIVFSQNARQLDERSAVILHVDAQPRDIRKFDQDIIRRRGMQRPSPRRNRTPNRLGNLIIASMHAHRGVPLRQHEARTRDRVFEDRSPSKRDLQHVRAGLNSDHVAEHPTSKRIDFARKISTLFRAKFV
jgi:hypothetical protein